MRTIAVVNQKGGCGKTITAINLSAFLALAGRRVLLVDMDPQGHSTLGLSAGGVEFARTLYDVLLSDTRRPQTTIGDITHPVSENLGLAPSDILLSAGPEALAGLPGRENVLTRALTELRDPYDYVIVDCPPNVGLLTFNALACTRRSSRDPSFFPCTASGSCSRPSPVGRNRHRISARVRLPLFRPQQFAQAVVGEVHRHLTGR
jgi:cellulose biosynthesis protein BcsQ